MERRLLIMRHAKSSWSDASLSDEERRLNKRGKAACKLIGKYLRSEGLVPDRIVCSTAVRARETAERVSGAGGFDAKIVVSPGLYLEGADAYLREIAGTGESVGTLLVIGHNPDVEELLTVLTGAEETVPTGAAACLAVTAAWPGIRGEGACHLDTIVRPRELEGNSDA